MNATYDGSTGGSRRVIPRAFNMEDPAERDRFLEGEIHEVKVPGSFRTIRYDPMRRTAVGISQPGTSKAVAPLGAHAFAIRKLDGDSLELRGRAR